MNVGDHVHPKEDDVADWFDYWIDTYAHPLTSLYANRWAITSLGGKPRAVIGTVERGGVPHIYDIERSSAT